MGELLPCPFCGSSMVDRFTSRCRSHYVAECGGCGASAPEERWNRRATHPQPVTPAGGECDACGGSGYTVRPSGSTACWKCSDKTPAGGEVEPSAMFSAICRTIALHFQAGKWITGPNTLALALEAVFESAHPPVADAALGVDESLNIEALRGLLRTYEKCPATGRREATALRAAIAALNQRGGGDHG